MERENKDGEDDGEEREMKQEPKKVSTRMKKFLCPKSGREEWANYAEKKNRYRCCKCGELHGEEAGN